jgi:hypothetical protein
VGAVGNRRFVCGCDYSAQDMHRILYSNEACLADHNRALYNHCAQEDQLPQCSVRMVLIVCACRGA